MDDVNINRILLQTKIRQLNAQIPVNRQMKADIVRVRNLSFNGHSISEQDVHLLQPSNHSISSKLGQLNQPRLKF